MKTEILFEDKEILVIYKPAGLATQAANFMQTDVFSELKTYLAMAEKGKKEPYLGIIHRLDQPVEGILVFAKTPAAAANLSKQIAQRMLKKEYLAAVYMEEKTRTASQNEREITLTDYLQKDGKNNLSKVVDANVKDAKKAVLKYRILGQKSKYALIQIQLETGRHHQIRVQCANAGFPLLGDHKYGLSESEELSKKLAVKDVVLCAYKLVFNHPSTGKKLEFCKTPQKPVLKALAEEFPIL